MTMRDFAQTIAHLHFKPVRLGQNSRAFHSSIHRRRINASDFFFLEPLGEPADLFAPFVRKLNVGGAGESIFRGKNSCPVSNEKHSNMHDRERIMLLPQEGAVSEP